MDGIIDQGWLLGVLVAVANAIVMRWQARDIIAADPSLRQPLNRLYLGIAFWVSLPFLAMGIFVLTGAATGHEMVDFLGAGRENPAVLAIHGLLMAESLLFFLWVWFRGGAERLSLHPWGRGSPSDVKAVSRLAAAVLAVAHTALFVHSVSGSLA